MKKKDLQKIRVENLNIWFNDRTVPKHEKSYISQLRRGKIAFGEKAARRLEKDYNMPSFFLDKKHDDKDMIESRNTFSVQVLDITANARSGCKNTDIMEVIQLIEYNKEQAKTLFNGLMSDNLKVINIRGDSMKGTFECGDTAYIDISVKNFDGDGIYVFTFADNLYVKRLQLIKNFIRVKSDNPLYDSWEIYENEINDLYIHGKVMFSQSMLLKRHA